MRYIEFEIKAVWEYAYPADAYIPKVQCNAIFFSCQHEYRRYSPDKRRVRILQG